MDRSMSVGSGSVDVTASIVRSMTVIYALVAGVCAGSLAMATIGNIPSDFLQLLSEKVNLLQIPFLEPRTVLNMAVSLFIGASAFWITHNIQEIRQTLGR